MAEGYYKIKNTRKYGNTIKKHTHYYKGMQLAIINEINKLKYGAKINPYDVALHLGINAPDVRTVLVELKYFGEYKFIERKVGSKTFLYKGDKICTNTI
jgi:hypothetical protein